MCHYFKSIIQDEASMLLDQLSIDKLFAPLDQYTKHNPSAHSQDLFDMKLMNLH